MESDEMGSPYYTFEEAARRLGRTKRSLHNYLKKGILRRAIDPEMGSVLYRDEVEQLAIDLGTDLPVLNRQTLFEILGRLRRLEQDNLVLKRMLGVNVEPLRPEKTEAHWLYHQAAKSLAVGKWEPQEMKLWADIFPRLDEQALEIVGEASGALAPWEVFYRLCTDQMKALGEVPDFKTNLDLQQLMQQLETGRKNLRSTAVIWIEMGRGRVSEEALKAVDNGKDDLLKRLVKKS